MGILIGILFTLPIIFIFGALPRTQITENIFVNLLDVLALLLLIIFSLLFILKKIKLRKNKIVKSGLIFITVLLTTLLLNSPKHTTSEILVGFLYWLRFASYMLLLVLIPLLTPKIRKWYEHLLLFASGLVILLGFVQYLLYPNLRNLYYLGWDEHLYRFFSSFLDPNFTGVIIVLVVFLFFEKWKSKKNNIWILGLFAGILALFLTYSRTAYASFLVSGLFYVKYIKHKYLILVAIFASASLLLIIPNLQSGEGVNIFRTYSVTTRVSEMKEGLEVFRESPVFGIGFNLYGHVSTSEESGYPSNASFGIPNSYVFTLATSGVIGLAAHMYFYITIINEGIRQKKLILITSTAVLLVSALFENTLYYNYILFLYFSIIGLYTQSEIKEKTEQ